MKQIKIYLFALLAALTVAACSNSDDNGGSGTSNSRNDNKNIVTIGVPAEVTRMEFPKIKGGTSQIIVHKTDQYGVNFCTEYDLKLKSQRWSCYAVYKTNNVTGWNRIYWKNGINGQPFQWDGKTWGHKVEPFQLDPAISADSQAGIHEYNNNKPFYARGHIVASQDRINCMDANGQTFYMTNMQPMQHEGFNDGAWSKMEEKIRNFASTYIKTTSDTMWVCKGGTIDKGDQIMGYTTNHFIIPKYFFAAVLVKNTQGLRAIGFWFEHKAYASSEKLSAHVVNIARLQELTGIDFFCNLPDSDENKVENDNLTAERIKSLWNITN